MIKTKTEVDAGLQNTESTGHAIITMNANRVGIDVHADNLCTTSNLSIIARQPFKFDFSTDVQHNVFFGSPRSGMSGGPTLPHVVGLADNLKQR